MKRILLTGGLGDIVIALPIAHHFYQQGHEILWPILPRFAPTCKAAAPWVNWFVVPVEPDEHKPMSWLDYFTLCGLPEFCRLDEDFLNLMDITPNRNETDMHLKFDQHRYAKAGLPFLMKWNLADCITRYHDQEKALKEKVVTPGVPYVVAHLQGSSSKRDVDFEDIEAAGGKVVIIEPGLTDNVFNWLTVLEDADVLYMYDSVFANIVDQMKLTNPKIFYRRSEMQMTPVMGMNWVFQGGPTDWVEQTEKEFIGLGYNASQYGPRLRELKKIRENREALLRKHGQ